MAKLQIRKLGDDVLRKVCRPVDEITPRILTLLDDMTETMRAADGCGLAAPQVGVLRRVVVIETEPGQVYELINPKIIGACQPRGDPDGPLRHGNGLLRAGADGPAGGQCPPLDQGDAGPEALRFHDHQIIEGA